MNTTAIYIKTEPEVKARAKEIARALGMSLNSLVNAYLRKLAKTKRITSIIEEDPNEYLINLMKKAEEDLKKGRASPAFDNAKDAIAWLHRK